MAYVAISGEFIERVRTKVQSMRNAELKTIGVFQNPQLSLNCEVVKKIWGEHIHLRQLMPHEWMNKYTYIDCRGRLDGKAFTFRVEFPTDCTMPPKYSNHGYEEVDIEWPELAPVKEYFTKKLEIDERWDSVDKKVVDYLHSCKSLNEAVKLWPDVTMYIDQHDVERMGVKRERAKESAALEALKALNTDELVGAAVIARMSGAQV